ncbi:hypothetical protein SETIT_9G459400v2 [Setaria italica]|uniref:Uncharacterized protein n=2 Tax=Setaria TaxID=4554 RepID=A0A368SSU0_SETIT|nr:hypothetical protein SETIT_9G459400v2 [Setaria italica]TKV96934.1 hypothetical protein SEVIR_9G462800v2 [Setaria viridis]
MARSCARGRIGGSCARGRNRRAYISPRVPICAARRFREREGETESEEGGGRAAPPRSSGSHPFHFHRSNAFVYIQALIGSPSAPSSTPPSCPPGLLACTSSCLLHSALLLMLGYTLLCCLR